MHKHIYLSLFLFLPAFAQSSGGASIHGTVRDAQAASVPGAAVSAFSRSGGIQINTTADSSGGYRLDGLAAGDYVLEASAPGFARFASEPVHLDRDASLTKDISLQVESARQQVVVTASGTALLANEVTKSVSVIDRRQIQEQDDISLTSALETVPGLRVQQLGGPGGYTSIKTRGLRNQDTAILFDGIRFRDITSPQGDATTFLQDFIDTDIDRIEVLRGAGSSLYGTNAIGGAVNLIGDTGGGRTRGSVLLEGGQLGAFRGTAQMAGGSRNNRLQYSAGLTHWNVTEGVGGHAPSRVTSGQGRFSYQLTPTVQLVARLYAADAFSLLAGEPLAIGKLPSIGIVDAVAPPSGPFKQYEQGVPISQLNFGNATFLPAPDDPDNSRAAHFTAGAFSLYGHPSERATYSITYQGSNTQDNFGNGPAGVGYQPLGNTHNINTGLDQIVNAQGSIEWSRHRLLNGGYEFESENYNSHSLQPGDIGNSRVNVSQRSNAVFLQEQERYFDDRLILAVSGRVQFFHLSQPDLVPSQDAPYSGWKVTSPSNAYTGDASAAWFFRSTGTKIRAHGSRGYRAPSLYERFGTYFDPIFGYSIYGNPLLTPEHSTSFDAGLDQAWWNNRIQASATYFYTRLENQIQFANSLNSATDPFGRYAGYVNGRGGLARGVETSIIAAPTRSLNVSGSYTYTNSQQATPSVQNIIRALQLPRHQFSLTATQRVGSRLLFNFRLVASSNYLAPVTSASFATLPFRFDGVHAANLGASYRLPLSEYRAIRFFGNITNLFDQAYYEAGFRTPGIGGTGGLQFEF